MQIEFTSEEMAFRAEARCWLRANVPAGERPIHSDRALDIREFDLEWQRKQFEAGWAGISWPREYRGRGVSLIEQLIWPEEYARVGVPWAARKRVGVGKRVLVRVYLGWRRFFKKKKNQKYKSL